MIVCLARDISPFVMYCVNGKPRSSLLIESTTDSMLHYTVINCKQQKCKMREGEASGKLWLSYDGTGILHKFRDSNSYIHLVLPHTNPLGCNLLDFFPTFREHLTAEKNKSSKCSGLGLFSTSLNVSSQKIQQAGCLHSSIQNMVCPCQLSVDLHPKKSIHPFELVTVETLGAVKLFQLLFILKTFHSGRLVKGKIT